MPSPHERGRGLRGGQAQSPGDREPYLFRTADYGATWTRIVTGLAPHDFTHSIREDPGGRACCLRAPNTASTSRSTMARVAVAAAEPARHARCRPQGRTARPGDRDARAMFSSSTTSRQLRQLAPAATAERRFTVFEPAERRSRSAAPPSTIYYCAQAARAEGDRRDPGWGKGQVIRSFAGVREEELKAGAAGAGGRRRGRIRAAAAADAADQRGADRGSRGTSAHAGHSTFPGMILWSAGSVRDPLAVPGTYQVRVTADGTSQTRPF